MHLRTCITDFLKVFTHLWIAVALGKKRKATYLQSLDVQLIWEVSARVYVSRSFDCFIFPPVNYKQRYIGLVRNV